jgi:hypothetical protein
VEAGNLIKNSQIFPLLIPRTLAWHRKESNWTIKLAEKRMSSHGSAWGEHKCFIEQTESEAMTGEQLFLSDVSFNAL